MASARKLGGKPGAYYAYGHLVGDEPGGKHQHVGIVMLFYQFSYGRVPGKSGTYALVMVQGHCHSIAGAADGNAKIAFSLLHGFAEGMGEIRIIATVGTVGAEIHDVIALAQQIRNQLGLVLHACVVAANTYFHNTILKKRLLCRYGP